MSSRTDDERGSLSSFLTCIVAALVLLILLVVESGRYVNRYLEMSDVTENAARIGAQSVVGIRAGEPHVDQRMATTEAQRYLRQNGMAGTVHVEGLRVMVSATGEWTPAGSLLFGARIFTIQRSAHVFKEN